MHDAAAEELIQPRAVTTLGADGPRLLEFAREFGFRLLGQQQAAEPAGWVRECCGDRMGAKQPE